MNTLVKKEPRRSATLVVIRDSINLGGIEVLLLKRADRNDNNGSAWVFPGGLVDEGDAQALNALNLGVTRDAIEAVTAMRECFEECGVLYAHARGGAEVDAWSAARWQAWREPLNRGERTMEAFVRESELVLSFDALVPLSRWVTPVGMPKRFDTRFFVARAPAAQEVTVDGTETVEHRWMRPADALLRNSGMKLLTPTRKTLEWLGSCVDVDAALAFARMHGNDQIIMPRLGRDRHGVRPVPPDEPAYEEIGRLDPEGEGTVSCVIVPGVAVRLSARIIRVTAPNPGVMTGPGTNSYLVGGGPANVWAVIDPGPDIDAHLDALLAAAPGEIRWIFVTHTHTDHSPLTLKLAARTGARIHGRVAAHARGQDQAFKPEVALGDGVTRFQLEGADTTLQAIHTPGHASNHICYLLEEESTLFTGDHVMQKATVVINPPDGDMAAYIASLQSLALHPGIEWLAPGHGFLIPQPRQVLEGIVEHRLKREAKVLAKLKDAGPSTLETLVLRVYDDAHAALHPVAQRSLLAHLLKLRAEGRAEVSADDQHWSLKL